MRLSSGLSRTGQLYLLRIEVDGHFHGGPPVHPWVAEITGPDATYGLARTFIRAMRDYAHARVSWRGNLYGVVATYPLRDGRLYEVCRGEGNSSKRRMVRRFIAIEHGKQVRLEPDDALARVDGGRPSALYRVPETTEPAQTWVARVTGLGTPERLGFVLVGPERRYRLIDGVYEVVREGRRSFIGVSQQQVTQLTDREALTWVS